MPPVATFLRAIWISIGIWAAASANADEIASRWSFGTQVGQVRGEGITARDPQWPSTMAYDASAMWGDKNRPGWRVFTGYQFNDYLAVHVGYADLGKVQSRFVQTKPEYFSQPEYVTTRKIRGVDVGLQLKIPFGERFAAALRGGKYYWRASTRTDLPWGDVERSLSRGSDGFVGAGLEMGLIDDLNATLGWTRYQAAGEQLSLWTVGVLYGFGFF